MRKSVWMFSGQGSQYYGMGRELFQSEPVFRQEIERADEIVRELTGASIVQTVYQSRVDRSEPFRRVLYSSPAIVATECGVARLLQSRGLRPDYLLGHSLGEVACMILAGIVSFEDAITLVVKLAEILEYCAPAGGMLAVLDSPDLMEQHPEEFAGCEVAGMNFSRNFLLAGLEQPLGRTQRFLKAKGILTVELPVAFAFHTKWTDVVAGPARALLASIESKQPQIPIVSAATGDLVPVCSGDHLWRAMRGRVDFGRAIEQMEKSGPYHYVDCGPSGSMATAVKYNLAPGASSCYFNVMTPFGQELKNLDRLANAARG